MKTLLTPHTSIPNHFILQIDNTSLETFATCPRASQYLLVSRRTTHQNAALTFGSAIHEGLEAYYKNPRLSDDHRLQLALIHTLIPFEGRSFPINEWRTADRACDTIQRYIKRYPTEPFTILDCEAAVELPFSIPLCTMEFNGMVNGVQVDTVHVYWTGKIDLAVQQDGSYWVMDHKTTSMVGPSFWDHFHLSNQTVGYVWAAQKLYNAQFAGLIVNCIVGRPITKSGTHTDFERQRFYYTPEQVNEWEENVKTMVGDFLANLHRNHFPMHTTWCIGKYGKCKFHDVCSLPNDSRMAMLNSDHYADNVWSPLN